MSRGTLVGPDQEALTFEDLIGFIETDYRVKDRKSTRQLTSSLKNLQKHMGKLRALDITTDRINLYIADRQEEGAARRGRSGRRQRRSSGCLPWRSRRTDFQGLHTCLSPRSGTFERTSSRRATFGQW